MQHYRFGEHVGFVDLIKIRGALEAPIPQRWYILRVHPNREFKVMKTFRQRNISAWLPLMNSQQRVMRGRHGYQYEVVRNVVSPLVSGAILIPDFECDGERWRGIDGVNGIYQMGPCTPFLTPKLIVELRNIEAIGNTPRSKRAHKFAIGALVRVTSGPFAWFCGRVERFDSRGRITVGVEIFGRLTPMELSESQIEAV